MSEEALIYCDMTIRVHNGNVNPITVLNTHHVLIVHCLQTPDGFYLKGEKDTVSTMFQEKNISILFLLVSVYLKLCLPVA